MTLKETLEHQLPGMSSENPNDRKNAEQSWQEQCFQLGAPGQEAERAEACTLMAERIGADTAKPARIWLLTQLERIGRQECVDAVDQALDDKEPRVREAALRALANNPSDQANEKLLARLNSAAEAKAKIGLLNAIGFRANPASVSSLSQELTNTNSQVATAAARALGKIATPEAARQLADVRDQTDGELRLWVSDAYLRCADRFAEQGDAKKAASIYKELDQDSEPEPVRLAAGHGLSQVAR